MRYGIIVNVFAYTFLPAWGRQSSNVASQPDMRPNALLAHNVHSGIEPHKPLHSSSNSKRTKCKSDPPSKYNVAIVKL